MKNRIGYLLVGAGIAMGAATLALSAPASAVECDVKQHIVAETCALVDESGGACTVAAYSDCGTAHCTVAVGSTCGSCDYAYGSDCAAEPTPTATPTAVSKILQLLESSEN